MHIEDHKGSAREWRKGREKVKGGGVIIMARSVLKIMKVEYGHSRT